jgi:hypothetical protein
VRRLTAICPVVGANVKLRSQSRLGEPGGGIIVFLENNPVQSRTPSSAGAVLSASKAAFASKPQSRFEASRLAHWFGTSARFWTNLHNQFDLAVARQKAGKTIAALPTRPLGVGDGDATILHSPTSRLGPSS